MYDLKTQFDVERFLGKTLEQVCFSKFQFELFFSQSIQVRIEGQPWYSVSGENFLLGDANLSPVLMIIGALQTSVVEASTEKENNLSLTFENGYKFFVYADDQYESYHITADGKTVTI